MEWRPRPAPATANDQAAEGEGWIEQGALGAVEILPGMLRGILQGGKYALAFGATAAGVAVVAGQAGPQALFPEELITAPIAGLKGVEIGQVYGSSKYWYEQGVGSMYDGLRAEGVPHAVAARISQVFGVPYAMIELVQVGKLVPGLKQKVTQAVSRKIAERLAQLATEKGVDYIEAVSQEVMQELVNITGEAMAEAIAGVKAPDDKRTAWERVKETLVQSIQVFPFLMGPKTTRDAIRATSDPGTLSTQKGGPPAEGEDFDPERAESFLEEPRFGEPMGDGINFSDENTPYDKEAQKKRGRLARDLSPADRALFEQLEKTLAKYDIQTVPIIDGTSSEVKPYADGRIELRMNYNTQVDRATKERRLSPPERGIVKAVAEEEFSHAAHLYAIRKEWIVKSKPTGNFRTYIDQHFKELWDGIDESIQSWPNAKERAAAMEALQASANIYAGELGASGTLDTAAVRRVLNRNPTTLLSEFSRQLVQLREDGKISESYLKQITAQVMRWVENALRRLKGAPGLLDKGVFGDAMRKEIERIEDMKRQMEAAASD